MTPRQAALVALQGARGIAPALGFHQTSVLVRTRTWTSGKVNSGTATVADLVLGSPDPVTEQLLPPHVVGTHGDAEITVGPLTPFDPVASPRGFTPAQLVPGPAPGIEYFYLVTFPGNVQRRYLVAPRGFTTTSSLHYTVKLQVIERPVPF
jgi:hypothetical protein